MSSVQEITLVSITRIKYPGLPPGLTARELPEVLDTLSAAALGDGFRSSKHYLVTDPAEVTRAVNRMAVDYAQYVEDVLGEAPRPLADVVPLKPGS